MRAARDVETAPVLLVELTLDRPLPKLVIVPARYRHARVLVRLHTTPIGEIRLRLGSAPLSAERLAGLVWRELASKIRAHLAADGLPDVRTLTRFGIDTTRHPPCLRDRRKVIAEPTPVTVVIATRNRTESLLACLTSVTRSDYPRFDIVVVDSAPSTDSTARVLERADWPCAVQYVHCPEPGLARAHNVALPEARGEVVAFTDDDVQVDRHWLSALVAAFDRPEVACVTGLILPVELETRAQVLIEQAGGFARGFSRHRYCLPGDPGQPLFPFTAGRFGSGANMAFRTRWLRRRCGFDTATGAGTTARGGDDLLAFLQVVLDRQTLVYEPAAIVRHRHQRDAALLHRQAFGYGVGLGAYLTAAVRAEPALLAEMCRRSVPALKHLLSPTSVKNQDIGPDYPRDLVWRERAGVVLGPAAYALSRRHDRRRADAHPTSNPVTQSFVTPAAR